MRSELVPRVAPAKVKDKGFGDYAVRFAFGAGIALVAGAIGMVFGPKVGGLFLGFPAILPASLTLIQKKEGKEEASIDSVGAALGAVGMIVFAVLITVFATRLGAVTSVLVALGAWVVVAVALYFLVALLFEREPSPS